MAHLSLKKLCFFFLLSFLAPLLSYAQEPMTTPPSISPPIDFYAPLLARAGAVQWSVRDAENYLKRYRAWLNWETSAPQPLEALDDISTLRRILINTIERQVIVQRARAEALTQGPIPGRPQLRDWLRNLIPGSMRPEDPDLDRFILGRLKMRAGEDLSFFWLAVEDAYWVKRFQDHLIAGLSEDEAQSEWRRRGELISAWIMQIPRVPTSSEISSAIREYPDEMKVYYDKHPELFSQPVRLLVEPYWIRGGKLDPQRKQAQEARDRVHQGEPLEKLLEELPMLTQGSVKTLRGRSIPPKTEVREGALTSIRLTRYGWTFYRIKRVYPAYVRSLQERSVQREVAAAVLRTQDRLPRAQKLARKALKTLKKTKKLETLKRWGRSRKIRVSAPDPFFASKQKVVPTIGLAPELHEQITRAQVGDLIEPVKVRQHYVVAKVLKRTQPQGTWADARDHFLAQWRRERTPQILDEWLTRQLKSEPRWISTRHLKQIRSEKLKFEAPLAPR